MENHGDEIIRDIMLSNFILILNKLSNIPINVFIEPLVRQTAYYGCCQLHFDLFNAIINHNRLHLKEAMLIIHLIGKICVSDLKYHKSALNILIKIIQKYHNEHILKEYCNKYFKVIFSSFVKIAQQQHLTENQSNPILFEQNFNKMEIVIKTLIEISKLNINPLNEMIKAILQFVIKDYAQLFGHIHPLLKILYTTLKTESIDTSRLSLKLDNDDDDREQDPDRDPSQRKDSNSPCKSDGRRSYFKSDQDSPRTNIDDYLDEHLDIHDHISSPEDTINKENKISTPELNMAVQSAKQKYIHSLNDPSYADDTASGHDYTTESHSIESSEMSEFEPDKPETVNRAMEDIKRYKAKYDKSREQTLEAEKQKFEKMHKFPSPKKPKQLIAAKKKRKNNPHQTSPITKNWKIDADTQLILDRHRHIFKLIADQYRGKKPTAIKPQSFTDIAKMNKMLSLAEYQLIFENYRVSKKLLTKNKLKGILREVAGKESYAGNMCTTQNLIDSLCYIAQYAKLMENKVDENVSMSEKLTNLLKYMRQQHKKYNLEPAKLWSSKPPPPKPKATGPKRSFKQLYRQLSKRVLSQKKINVYPQMR